MRHILASLIVVALVGPALAQPPPQQPYQPQPQPQGQPQTQQAAWYRFTLNDGRVIDVQIVGGDATNWHFLQNGQLYSIPKATVVGSISLAALQAPPPPAYAPAPQYAPPPQYAPMPPPPPAGESDTHLLARRRAGWAYFGSSYLLTVMIALARHDNDPDALAGLIPVAGPIIWTVANDDDDIFEDGWDWLAATDALIQGAGLVWAFSGPSGSSKRVAVTPTARRGFHGIALGGTW